MLESRVIPCLLLQERDLVKTVRFSNPRYVGDPINAVRIFNEKEVDELVILDITASRQNQAPNLALIEEIASECFMPLGYGGGIRNLEDMKRIFALGVEKVVLNTAAFRNPEIIREASEEFGSQSILVSIDVKKPLFGGQKAYFLNATKASGLDPVGAACRMQELGAGELILYSIDRDGTGKGYDLELIKKVSSAVDIPVIALGGAGSIDDLLPALREGGASAVGAGSLFVFHGKHKAVLISYPPISTLERVLG